MKSFGIFASVQFHAKREIFPFKNAKIRLQLETGKWPDPSDRGDSMTSLVALTFTPPVLEKGVHTRHACRIFVEIAIVT